MVLLAVVVQSCTGRSRSLFGHRSLPTPAAFLRLEGPDPAESRQTRLAAGDGEFCGFPWRGGQACGFHSVRLTAHSLPHHCALPTQSRCALTSLLDRSPASGAKC